MDTLRLDQQYQHLDDTPVRRGGPRYRRTNSELLIDGNSICPRRWLPMFTQAAANESPVQRQDLPDDERASRPNLPMARQTYAGDRFIPRRHNFQASHHLLTRRPGDWEDKSEIDYCKQVELLDVTYRREAMRAMMINQECVTGLNQKRILQIFIERRQGSSDSAATRSTFATEGKWKCAPRKKPLIRSPEKMLNLSTDPSDGARPIDWSCTDVFVVGGRNGLTIYDSNGMVLDGLRSWDAPTAVKWSNDGAKIACTFRTSMKLKLYDSRRKKFLWSVLCCCSVNIYVDSCTNCCICWSHNDRRIVTACSGTLSVFESDTGKLLLKKHAHSADIMSLSFSSNFKYLVSTGQDKCVRIHIWPYLTEWYNITFSHCVKAVAWHPEVSGLLCIGGSEDASLSLWNINTYAMIDYLPAKFEGRVENLAWNKLSGELVVHWSYPVGNNRHSVMPVLANFERTVDAIPLDKDERLSFLKFNTTQKQLMTYCYDVFSIWNFFGDEKPPGGRCLPLYSAARQGTVVRNFIR